MTKKLFLIASAGAIILFSGCAGDNAVLNYKDYNAYSDGIAGNHEYKEIKPLTICRTNYIWNIDYSCQELSKEVLKELKTRAEDLGGNGIVDVTWYPGDPEVTLSSKSPVCDNDWLKVHTCATGVAVKFKKQNESKNKKVKDKNE